jgi:hypothetical protein
VVQRVHPNRSAQQQVLHVLLLLLKVEENQPCCYCRVAGACCSMPVV